MGHVLWSATLRNLHALQWKSLVNPSWFFVVFIIWLLVVLKIYVAQKNSLSVCLQENNCLDVSKAFLSNSHLDQVRSNPACLCLSVCLSPLKNRSFCWILALAEITLRHSLMTTLRYFKCLLLYRQYLCRMSALFITSGRYFSTVVELWTNMGIMLRIKEDASHSNHRGFFGRVYTDCYKLSSTLRYDLTQS